MKRLRELAQHPAFCMVRVMPLASQVPTNDARHYPIYQVCEELGIPVGINAGIPGPRVRSRVQHPELLEDVLIDFPDLTVIVAHMGHPVRRAAHELHAQMVEPLRLVHRVRAPLHGPEPRRVHEHEDVPRPGALGQRRAVVPDARARSREAKSLPLDDEAMALFLGGTARRLLDPANRYGPGIRRRNCVATARSRNDRKSSPAAVETGEVQSTEPSAGRRARRRPGWYPDPWQVAPAAGGTA